MAGQPSRRSVRRRRIAAAAVAVVILAGGGLILKHHAWTPPAPKSAGPSAIPVTVAAATVRDVPIYRDGLGTIQASNTTAIHTQVDGKLQSVDFTEGQNVRKGDVLARIDPRYYQATFDQAKAKKAQDQAQLVGAEKDLARYKALVLKDFGTQQSVDQQQATVDRLKAMIEADQAAIESTQTQLDYTTIAAPTDGRMGIRLVDPGNIVHVTDTTPISVLTQLRPISAIFTLPQQTLAEVRQAMGRGPVQVLAYDQNNAKLLGSGTLLLIDNEIDQTTSTIKLKAIFPNDDETLWPGESVHAHVLLDTRWDALTVPNAAVQRGPDGLFAWLLRPDRTVEPRPLDVAQHQQGLAILNGGLAAGDEVVVSGQYRLQAGAHVVATTAPASVASRPAPRTAAETATTGAAP